MNLVVDANLVVSLVLPLPYSDLAREKLLEWKHLGKTVLAPTLLEYEVVSVLRKAITIGAMDAQLAQSSLDQILRLNIRVIPPTNSLHLDALTWAERLRQAKAYDAQYLALAASLGLPLWTADRRLANRAAEIGVNWVHCID